MALPALQDDRINRAEILFPGVGCFLIAAIVGLLVHASNTDDINAKLGIRKGHWLKNITAKESHEVPPPNGQHPPAGAGPRTCLMDGILEAVAIGLSLSKDHVCLATH